MVTLGDPRGLISVAALIQSLAQASSTGNGDGTRSYRCRCGRAVFFRNSVCLACNTPLGYEPSSGQVVPLVAGEIDGTWHRAGHERILYWRCANLDSAGCNWLVDATDAGNTRRLCIACRLNRTIPDLSIEENRLLWGRIEVAKRRLVADLLLLGLPVASRVDQDGEKGLAFDFLRQQPGGPAVLTGHDGGVITLNIEEADDVKREETRANLHEPYRTLLGHLRHEIGHYYWDRLIAGSERLAEFRELFGDERADYAAALQRNYEQDPPADWRERHVSAYASVHPWEDWAETWAHYLHMVAALETSLSFGLEAGNLELEIEPFSRAALWRPDDPGAERFLFFLNAWIQLTAVLNEMSRAMGQPDLYPFAIPRAAVSKLQFIHIAIAGD